MSESRASTFLQKMDKKYGFNNVNYTFINGIIEGIIARTGKLSVEELKAQLPPEVVSKLEEELASSSIEQNAENHVAEESQLETTENEYNSLKLEDLDANAAEKAKLAKGTQEKDAVQPNNAVPQIPAKGDKIITKDDDGIELE